MAVSVEKDKLNQILKAAKNLLDLNDFRAVCNTLRFEFERGTCQIIATNSHRLGVFELPYSGDGIENFTMLYTPMDFGKGTTTVEIAYQEKDDRVCFSTAAQSFSVPLTDITYPDWRRMVMMDGAPKYSLCFNRQSLIKTLQSLSDGAVILNVYGGSKPLKITDTQDKNTRLVAPILKNN